MCKAASVAAIVSVMFGATASAQQTLSVDVLENYGSHALQSNAAGCFDVLAAIRLHTELEGRAFTDPTKQAFSSGTCIVAARSIDLANAQKVEIGGAVLIRGDVPDANVTVYFPVELLNVNSSDTAMSSLTAIAADLRRRVGEMERCSQDRDVLDEKIVDFNARVEAALAEVADGELATGSRLKNNSSTTVTSIELADTAADAFREESVELQTASDAHKERCGAYEGGIVLDQDYMPFYRATNAARS